MEKVWWEVFKAHNIFQLILIVFHCLICKFEMLRTNNLYFAISLCNISIPVIDHLIHFKNKMRFISSSTIPRNGNRVEPLTSVSQTREVSQMRLVTLFLILGIEKGRAEEATTSTLEWRETEPNFCLYLNKNV